MARNEFLANLPIDERNLFMPCPYCQQGDHFQVFTVQGMKIFWCSEFGQTFMSSKWDRFIRDPAITVDTFEIDRKIEPHAFEKSEWEVEKDEPFNPFLPELDWKMLVQEAIESGMEEPEYLPSQHSVGFRTWFHMFDFSIGLFGEQMLRIEVVDNKQFPPTRIMYLFPVHSKEDTSWRALEIQE